jgi:hypothetical protein
MDPLFVNVYTATSAENKEFEKLARQKLDYKGAMGVLTFIVFLLAGAAGISLLLYIPTRQPAALFVLIGAIVAASVCLFIRAYISVMSRKAFGGLRGIDGQKVSVTFYQRYFDLQIDKYKLSVDYQNVWDIAEGNTMIVILFGEGGTMGASAPVSRFQFKEGDKNDFLNFLRKKCTNVKVKKEHKLTK